jgi:hypothetical protein
LGQPDILPVLEGLTVGNIPIFLPPATGIRESYDGTLNGRPLILSEHAAAFSSQGDLSLLALNGYRTITKAGGIETATSMHLYFDANATAFRFIFRLEVEQHAFVLRHAGRPLIVGGARSMAGPPGSATQHPIPQF